MSSAQASVLSPVIRSCAPCWAVRLPLICALFETKSFPLCNLVKKLLVSKQPHYSFFNAVLEAIFLLYYSQNLGLSAVQLGIIFGAGSIGFFVGVLLPTKVASAIGLGPSIIVGMVTLALADMVAPLVGGPVRLNVGLLIAAQVCFGLGLTLFSVGQVSVRQAATPDAI
jgi:Na+/melibiose symporter-like transporter